MGNNILSLLEVDRGLLDLLLLNVNRARDKVRVSEGLVQFISLKVVDYVLDQGQSQVYGEGEILLYLEYLANLVLSEVNTDQTLCLSVFLIYLIHLNHFFKVLLSSKRILKRLHKHHLKCDMSSSVLKAFSCNLALVICMNLLHLFRASQFQIA